MCCTIWSCNPNETRVWPSLRCLRTYLTIQQVVTMLEKIILLHLLFDSWSDLI